MFKILIVEDDRDLNRSVCSFLNGSGYEAVGCLCAEDAYDEMYKTTFGDETMDALTQKRMLGGVGFAVSGVIVAQAIHMIVQSTKELKRMKNEVPNVKS